MQETSNFLRFLAVESTKEWAEERIGMPNLASPRTTRPRAMRTLLSLGLAWAPLCLFAQDSQPMGQVLFAARSGEVQLISRTYLPPRIETQLGTRVYQNGTVEVDRTGMIVSGSNFSGSRSEMRGPMQVDPNLPRISLNLAHPALDYTGRRVLFTGGDSWGPEKVPGAKPSRAPVSGPVAGGTAIYFGDSPSGGSPYKLTDPNAGGAVMDAFAASDSFGRRLFFSRFFRQPSGEASVPGWYLMMLKWKDADQAYGSKASPPTPEFFKDQDGTPVRGLEPQVSADGKFLIYVKPDPRNVGSDIWSVSLDPATDDASGGPQTVLWEGEGAREFQKPTMEGKSAGNPADPASDWYIYSEFLSRARISHPVLASDRKFLVFASDRDGNWDLYSVLLEEDSDGNLIGQDGSETPVHPDRVVDLKSQLGRSRDDLRAFRPFDENDTTHETWPAISSDGQYLAYVSDQDQTDGTTRVRLAACPHAATPVTMDREVDLSSTESMWPLWDQDEDPPHVRIVLRTTNDAPTVLKILDREPDPNEPVDVAQVTLQMENYYAGAPPAGDTASPRQPPLDVKDDDPALVQYPVAPWDDSKSPEENTGNSFRLLVSGAKETLGLHRSFPGFFAEGSTAGPDPSSGDFAHAQLVNDEFQGLFLWENERLAVEVLARDNRWLRVGPGSDGASLGYDPDPAKEVTQILPKDPRASLEGTEPPYFPVIPRDENMEKFHPGISWWIEELPAGKDGSAPDHFTRRNENQPYMVFRFPNFPQEAVAGTDKDIRLFLRVVVRDLMQNTVDVRFPIFVRGKDFNISTLDRTSERGGVQ